MTTELKLVSFAHVTDHLAKRGFATRVLWNGMAVLVFGMDNVGYLVPRSNTLATPIYWSPNLDELNAKDWIVLPYFYFDDDNPLRANSKRPFEQNDPILELLYARYIGSAREITIPDLGPDVEKDPLLTALEKLNITQ